MNTKFKQSVVYQIYPKSFQDSNGDGIGDIQGIISRLDYLAELGVDYLWLTPPYVSPQRDNGYDIADYYEIDPLYGTMADFDELLAQAHAKGLKIIMDLVVNHTSTEHEWFKQARTGKDNPYYDYYIWRDQPNNWQSKFGGTTWEYNQATNTYYLHLFDKTQADLNWENPKMRQDIYKMMRWWLTKGIDGFRLDVVNLLSKDQRFLDDTLASATADGRKFYTDGPRIHEFLHEMNREVLAQFPDALTTGEMSSTNLASCIRYTNPANEELDMVFNFHHLKVDYKDKAKWTKTPFDFAELKQLFTEWQVGMHEGGGWNALFWNNHDQPRALSRFGNDHEYRFESATMLATVLHGMQGTPYIYQGEEFATGNPDFTSIHQYRDVESLNAFEILRNANIPEAEVLDILAAKSRDNGRTPMTWDSGHANGFTSGKPWISAGRNADEVNAAADCAAAKSVFKYYQKLIQLRKEQAVIVDGDYQPLFAEHAQLFAYSRNLADEHLLVLANFYDTPMEIDLSAIEWLKGSQQVLISNAAKPLERLEGIISLQPYETYMVLG
ncbi:alpha,alpha-phosphotrehalase [Culicoidibacter larvae]|uniref:Alpha,alpha-phosphotrehalase n=1 Tax=Culicoidibacter larvae TaxID=2579976 RepID=A0A5R8QAR0_9FIRM|nr:alpha,alpha-phosphotrehalase [Culicoidibacter larvae]TLG73006.1 alpha,alpha-phosphotrehalase [Culicoidibacter larvae]